MSAAELATLLRTLTPSQMRSVITCFWVWDEAAFVKAVKASTS